MELERDSFSKGEKLDCIQLFLYVSFSAVLGIQTLGETII